MHKCCCCFYINLCVRHLFYSYWNNNNFYLSTREKPLKYKWYHQPIYLAVVYDVLSGIFEIHFLHILVMYWSIGISVGKYRCILKYRYISVSVKQKVSASVKYRVSVYRYQHWILYIDATIKSYQKLVIYADISMKSL